MAALRARIKRFVLARYLYNNIIIINALLTGHEYIRV